MLALFVLITVHTVMNYNFITNRVATGGRIETVQDVQTLVDAGITHIIDCRAEFDDAPLLVNFPTIKYLWNGVNDDGKPKPVDWFQRSIEFALPALAAPGNKVYVHCAEGVNRGPSTTYAILRAQGLQFWAAELMIRFHRPIALMIYRHDADAAIVALKYE